MSYEGHVQIITKKGNYDVHDDSGGNRYEREPQSAWLNRVDDTNCEAYREIPYEVLRKFYLFKEAVYKACDLGHNHCISQEVFRIPGKESKYLQHKQLYEGTSCVMKPLYLKEYKDLCVRLKAGEVFGTNPEP